jgi:hypothetical protein
MRPARNASPPIGISTVPSCGTWTFVSADEGSWAGSAMSCQRPGASPGKRNPPDASVVATTTRESTSHGIPKPSTGCARTATPSTGPSPWRTTRPTSGWPTPSVTFTCGGEAPGSSETCSVPREKPSRSATMSKPPGGVRVRRNAPAGPEVVRSTGTGSSRNALSRSDTLPIVSKRNVRRTRTSAPSTPFPAASTTTPVIVAGATA